MKGEDRNYSSVSNLIQLYPEITVCISFLGYMFPREKLIYFYPSLFDRYMHLNRVKVQEGFKSQEIEIKYTSILCVTGSVPQEREESKGKGKGGKGKTK